MLQISLYKRMFRGRGCKVAMVATAGRERFLHTMDEAVSWILIAQAMGGSDTVTGTGRGYLMRRRREVAVDY